MSREYYNISARPNKWTEIRGVRISYNHGRSWSLKAYCKQCIEDLEPPIRVKDEGAAGVYKCDGCGAGNLIFNYI